MDVQTDVNDAMLRKENPDDVRDVEERISQQKKEAVYTPEYTVIKTIFMVLAPIVLGIYLELAGPTLPDLMQNVNANYVQISHVLVFRSVGFFISSLAGGFLTDKFPDHIELLISVAFLTGAVGTFLAPWVTDVWVLGLLFHLQGLGHGSIDTCNNFLCIRMWQQKASAPVHALHFGFGIGGFMALELARPFVSHASSNMTAVLNNSMDDDTYSVMYTDLNTSMYTKSHDVMYEVHNNVTSSGYTPEQTSRIDIPYTISAALATVFSVGFLGFYFYEKCSGITHIRKSMGRRIHDLNKKQCLETISPSSCTNGDTWFGIKFFLLIFFFFFTVVGGERSYSKYVYSYATKGKLNFSSEAATTLNSVFWISFTCGRGLAIILAKWVSPRILLIVEIVMNIVACSVLAIFGHKEPTVVWIMSGVLGLFLSPVFPAGIAWANRYVIMRGTAVAIVFVGSASGGMFYQWLNGFLFQHHGPHTLMYVLLGYALSLGLLLVLLLLLVRGRPDRYQQELTVSVDVKTNGFMLSKTDQGQGQDQGHTGEDSE